MFVAFRRSPAQTGRSRRLNSAAVHWNRAGAGSRARQIIRTHRLSFICPEPLFVPVRDQLACSSLLSSEGAGKDAVEGEHRAQWPGSYCVRALSADCPHGGYAPVRPHPAHHACKHLSTLHALLSLLFVPPITPSRTLCCSVLFPQFPHTAPSQYSFTG